MANAHPSKPSTPHSPPPKPPSAPPPPAARHEGAKHDPQDDKPVEELKAAFRPEPSLDPRADAPHDAYVDGMPIADEQRARSGWIEGHGLKAYHDAVDDRTEEEKEKRQVQGVTPPTKRE
jgi:hypothetical protein